MSNSFVYLTEADVVSLVDLSDTIDALEAMLPAQAKGDTVDIPKALGTFDAGASALHALGSAFPAGSVGGFKTWINTPRGAVAVMTLFDTAEGRLLGVLEAGALGQLRTAAISGLATRWLAAPDADDMALIGTGRQALAQLASVAAVRKLRRVRVWSPSADSRDAFVRDAAASFPFRLEASGTLDAAVEGAAIVTLVTRARQPFLHAASLGPDVHLNAVGAILPGNAEFFPDVFDRASRLVVDSLPGVQANSREFVDRFGAENGEGWRQVETLGRVIAEGPRPRPPGLTLFKAMGMGVSDLAVARLAVERARQASRGTTLPAPRRAALRWVGEPAAAAE